MSNRLTKQQMKTDQLQHALTDARDYVAAHRSETTRWALIAGGAVLVLGAIWGGIVLRNDRLAARFSSALALFDAPLASDAAPASGARVFKDVAERTAAAKSELASLVKDAPSSPAGRAAAVVVLSLDGPKAATGANLDAAKAFAKSESGTVAAGVAAVAAIDAEAAAGRPKEALETAKRYLDASDSPVSKDILVFTMARLYEQTGQNVDAKSFYQRLVTDFPDSPLRTDAQQKLASL
ncbi:MAG: tetratricopeptide repeat protein [Thermoanaerobaculia bacterium]